MLAAYWDGLNNRRSLELQLYGTQTYNGNLMFRSRFRSHDFGKESDVISQGLQ